MAVPLMSNQGMGNDGWQSKLGLSTVSWSNLRTFKGFKDFNNFYDFQGLLGLLSKGHEVKWINVHTCCSPTEL